MKFFKRLLFFFYFYSHGIIQIISLNFVEDIYHGRGVALSMFDATPLDFTLNSILFSRITQNYLYLKSIGLSINVAA